MHDAKGRELKVGDLVMVPCRVKQTSTSEDYCNVTLETIATMPPYAAPEGTTTISAINTRQVLRANDGDDLNYNAVQAADGQIRLE